MSTILLGNISKIEFTLTENIFDMDYLIMIMIMLSIVIIIRYTLKSTPENTNIIHTNFSYLMFSQFRINLINMAEYSQL